MRALLLVLLAALPDAGSRRYRVEIGGRAVGVATLLLDIGKGYLAVWLAGRLTGGSELWTSAAALRDGR